MKSMKLSKAIEYIKSIDPMESMDIRRCLRFAFSCIYTALS